MSHQVVGSDGSPVPEGWLGRPHCAELQQAAAIALTTPTTATIITDADGWAAGDQQPAAADGGPVVDEVAGTITLTRTTTYRARYGQSDITVVNGQVLTAQLFGGSAGTTALGGKCVQTQLTAAPCSLNGEALFEGAIGDVISVKVIADTGNYTSAAGFLIVQEV